MMIDYFESQGSREAGVIAGRAVAQHSIVNGLSVDVEDWFQVGAFEHTIKREDWDGLELRVGDNVARILDLFDEAGVKATFFTLGWVAERNRAAMRAIVERGHELASHGYDHARVHAVAAGVCRRSRQGARDPRRRRRGRR